MLLLLLGMALLLGASVQAVRTARAQQRMNARVLESYARVAAWNFEEQMVPAVHDHVVEPLFHPLHLESYADGRVRPASVGALLKDRDPACPTCPAPWRFALFGVRFEAGGGREELSAGAPPTHVREVVQAVRARRARRDGAQRMAMHEGTREMLVLSVGDSAAVVLHYAKPVPGDTLVYAVVLRPGVLAPVFDHVLATRSLLPEPLLQGVEKSDLLVQSVWTPDGRRVYGTELDGGYLGERRLARLGGLVLRVRILNGAERYLIPGAAAGLRWPILLGLLVVALGMMVAVFSQIRREHALSRLRADFVSSVSHELRTPLALQRIFLDTLRLDRATTEERRAWCLENIDRESLRLAHLVENVLLFSRSERGGVPIAPQHAQLAPVMSEILRAFEPLAASAQARITSTLDEAVAATFDAGALRQILINLLENAVKYGPRGQRIHVALLLVGGDRARITVDDEGPGVPPAERDVIFEPYQRGAGTQNGAVAGSGIGLAVVRNLVHAHGGRVSVEDAPGGGARFVVELPAATRAASERASSQVREDAGAATRQEEVV